MMNFVNNNALNNHHHQHNFEKVKVRNEQDIIMLRRAFQNIYQDKLRDLLKNQAVEPKIRTAYILRLSQLENSLFENVKKHINIIKEETEQTNKTTATSNESGILPKSPILETFDKNLKRSVDALEAKLLVLAKDVQNMRQSISKKAVKVHSLADELEGNDCFDENGELILPEDEKSSLNIDEKENGNTSSTAQIFNKEIYNSLKRKVSLINRAVEDLSEGMPTILANAYHDLKTAEQVLKAPLSSVDIAMQTNLVTKNDMIKINQQNILGAQLKKKKRKLIPKEDNSDNEEGSSSVSVNSDMIVSNTSSITSPRTNLRDLLLRS